MSQARFAEVYVAVDQTGHKQCAVCVDCFGVFEEFRIGYSRPDSGYQ